MARAVHNARCYDTGTGLWVTYYVVGPGVLYNPLGAVIKDYVGYTVQNTDWQTTCGPADNPNVIAYASDGSGQYIKVHSYWLLEEHHLQP